MMGAADTAANARWDVVWMEKSWSERHREDSGLNKPILSDQMRWKRHQAAHAIYLANGQPLNLQGLSQCC